MLYCQNGWGKTAWPEKFLLTCKKPLNLWEDLTVWSPQVLHYGTSFAFGGSNWLAELSAGLATLLAQQGCVSASPSGCSAWQGCSSSADATSRPSKPTEKLRVATAVVPGELAEIQGLWSLVERSILGRAGVLDSWETSVTPHAFFFPSVHSPITAKKGLCMLNIGKDCAVSPVFWFLWRWCKPGNASFNLRRARINNSNYGYHWITKYPKLKHIEILCYIKSCVAFTIHQPVILIRRDHFHLLLISSAGFASMLKGTK